MYVRVDIYVSCMRRDRIHVCMSHMHKVLFGSVAMCRSLFQCDAVCWVTYESVMSHMNESRHMGASPQCAAVLQRFAACSSVFQCVTLSWVKSCMRCWEASSRASPRNPAKYMYAYIYAYIYKRFIGDTYGRTRAPFIALIRMVEQHQVSSVSL